MTGLRMEVDQRLGLRQRLAPGLSIGMDILAAPLQDLAAKVELAAAENPFLILDSAPSAGRVDTEARIATAVPTPQNLCEHLRLQLAGQRLPPRVRALAEYLSEDLDARGYLPEDDETIAAQLGARPGEVAAARDALQACEPAGVAARDLADCLRLQLQDEGMDETQARSVCGVLGLLARGRMKDAASALGVRVAEAEALADRIARLSPEPAAQIAALPALPLLPELQVTLDVTGQPQISPVEEWAPSLRVDKALIRRAAAGPDESARGFVAVHRAEARQLIMAMSFRKRTLLRVGGVLVERQAPYFAGHAAAPLPLSRRAVAEELGLHPATVGRAVTGSALLFHGRTYPLSAFFPSAVQQSNGGVRSSAEIQDRLRKIIAAEREGAVLSDDEIASRLGDLGVDIARRTVAKYRKCMDIPSKSQRRRRLSLQARRSAGRHPAGA
ncbi:MAG: hypothetical protein AAFU80_22305 [Pseudomonadota bacterium]